MNAPHTWTRNKKIALGVASIWPFIYITLFFLVIVSVFVVIATNKDSFPFQILLILPLHLLTMILTFGTLGLCIFDLFKNSRINEDRKVLWALVLFFGNIFSIPFYWYLYIWKSSESVKKIK